MKTLRPNAYLNQNVPSKVEEAKRQIDYLTKKLQAIEQEIAQLSEEYRKLTGKNE